MAYKIDMKRKCRRCDKTARFQVFNTYNSPDGHFCARHADERVAELNKVERAQADV